MTVRDLVWLDLCSGLGGASQPALDRGWKVIRVDIDPRFKPDIVADVRVLPLKPFHVDVLWASPPCQEFSKWGMRCFFPNPSKPDLSIVESVLSAIERLSPDWWYIENVLASRSWLTHLIGPPFSVLSGHVIWADSPTLLPLVAPHKGNYRSSLGGHRSRTAIAGRHYRPDGSLSDRELFDAARIAKIPYEIGEAICIAVEKRLEVFNAGAGEFARRTGNR